MKKLILFLFMLIIAPVQSAQIANVEYIHTAIADKWDITIPYNREITNVGVAANMKYLLTAVDVANEILNGEKTTDYGNGEFATMVAADTIATDTAVETLVMKNEKNVLIMTVGSRPDGIFDIIKKDFAFGIGAAGTFYIDWGDGTTQVIEKPDTTYVEYRHSYPADLKYRVRMNGTATQYGTDATFNTCNGSSHISCHSDFWVHKVQGCLGCIFPTLADGTQPKFDRAFMGQSFLTGELPAGFFAGIHGKLREGMFSHAFNMTGLTSIGSPLFDDLSGGMTRDAFSFMFGNCYELTGESAKMKLNDGTIKYLYEVYPDATYNQVEACYYNSSGFDDYANIPHNWTYWDI